MIHSADILKASILIVDDQAANISLLEQMLEEAGYTGVTSTMNPREVRELYHKHHYDLILLDLHMPGMDGFQVMESLKEADGHDYLPVLVITAQPGNKLRALQAGAKDFIGKPFELGEILARVHNLLEVRLLHKEAEVRVEQAEVRTEEAVEHEQRMRASELSYRRLFEAARDGILILDAQTGRINDVNPFLFKLLGFTRSEMIGKTVGELSPFKDIESNQVMLERLQRDGYVRYEDLPLEARDGRHVAVEFVSNVYQAGDCNVIQCNVRDITERKRVQTALVRLAAIVESSDDAIIGNDLDSTITSWNRGAEKIFGYTAGEIVGTSIMRLIPADRQEEEGQIWGMIKRGGSVEDFETQRLTRDGRPIHVSVTASPIKDAAGQVTGMSKVARDITGRKAAEAEIRKLNVELEQRVTLRTAQLKAANEELEAFSYSVSHDLRAPLRHVLGFLELLKQEAGPSLSEKSLRHLTTISGAAVRMGALIDDLLAFARIGKTAMQKADVNLNELVRETVGDFALETKARKIAWKIHPLPPAWADRALLGLVLVNLVANAVKFTGTRTEPRIEIGCLPEGGGETVIFVRDNGAGFDPQHAHKLFGVFQRLHSQAEFAGTGIGLANVLRIMKRHGGRAWAEGAVDGGATFYISLPKAKESGHGH